MRFHLYFPSHPIHRKLVALPTQSVHLVPRQECAPIDIESAHLSDCFSKCLHFIISMSVSAAPPLARGSPPLDDYSHDARTRI